MFCIVTACFLASFFLLLHELGVYRWLDLGVNNHPQLFNFSF
ncbi:Protein of unknown function [Pyronema omphalodes CBS 100304]|uniref:Uncharacterized protein n=1 Tax=Pyronema omphalodes (strain CBS 100304) TaxID=1076935 RepID=U4LVU7_PYROM|nr:Protein of unknown function [Pyronema omphalodes CBS 100304]